MISELRLKLALTGTTAMALIAGYGRRAYAACTLTSPNIYTCANANTTTQTITGDGTNVATVSGFGVTTTTGNAISITGAGPLSFNDQYNSTIKGAGAGLYVSSTGSGALSITTTGAVTGSSTNGIYAKGAGAGTMTIMTGASGSVSGGQNGVLSDAAGTGATNITIGGVVTGTSTDGVNAHGSATMGAVTIVTNAGSSVSGGVNGVYSRNYGTGALSITVNGDASGLRSAGVLAYNSSSFYAQGSGWAAHPNTGGTDLTVETGADSSITGAVHGIFAINNGAGATAITVRGEVTGQSQNGVYVLNTPETIYSGGKITAVQNSPGGTNLTVTTYASSTVTGAINGIKALNSGTGALSITANGAVTGTSRNGIYAANTHTLTGGGYVFGPNQTTTLTTTWPNAGTSLSIVTGARSVVQGQTNGISTVNQGTSYTQITANGTVTGTTSHGISAVNSDASTTLGISVGTAGLVQGNTDGVYADSTTGAITIANAGTIQNLSGSSADLAITTLGPSTAITNTGLILGTVNLGGSDSNSVTNSGTWNTAGGTNDFESTATNSVTNAAGGVIIAANDPSAAQTTTFNGLGTFTNAGTLTMQDGLAGDRTVITGNYVGQGGTIAIDTYLGADGSASDRLVLNGGTATGNSFLAVSNTTGMGAQTQANGIEVIEADNGATTAANAFQLKSAVAAGAYQYFLYRGGPSAVGSAGDGGTVAQNWYLRSNLTPPPPPPPVVTPPPMTNPPSSPSSPSSSAPPSSPPAAIAAAQPTYPNYRPEVPVYLAMSEMASEMGFATIDNLLAREGDAFEAPAVRPWPVPTVWCKNPDLNNRCPLPNTKSPQNDLVERYGMWSRILAFTGAQLPGDRSLSANNSFLRGEGPSYTYTLGGFQAGMTFLRRDGSDGSRDRAGFYVGDTQMWGNVSQVYSGVYSTDRAGNVDLNGAHLAAYWTHYGPNGWYSDSIVQGTWYDRAQGDGNLSSMNVQGAGVAVSEELGDPFQLPHGFMLEPQVQAIYEHVHLDSGYDAYGYTSFGAGDDLRARIGARLATATGITTASGGLIPLSVWGRFNVWHDFLLNRPAATFSTVALTDPTTLTGALQGTWGEVDAGAAAQITRTISLFGSAVYDHSITGSKTWATGGRLGVNVAW